MMRMRLKQYGDGTARYAIGNGTRWIYGLFSLAMSYGLMTVILDRSFTVATWFPLLLLLLGLLGLGYREGWEFNPNTQTIFYTFGFYLFIRRERFDARSVQRIEITHFVRGRSPLEAHAQSRGRNKAMVVFSLHMADDSVKDVEIIPERSSGGSSERAAQVIAALMDIPFHADREPDVVQSVSFRDLCDHSYR